MSDRFIRLPEVKHLTGLSRTNIYGKIARGEFPKQRSYGGQGTGSFWLESEVEAWKERVAARADLDALSTQPAAG